ncbi:hypothetical protein POVWA2_084700 [Plasmodium ovale wallikeri]|uniref:Uncharacterized protein n=1 Tax=Plasmodium ovale wallikeri TaxID=864142 RepID=A0A1A9AQ84_PLAOA|nr:hypothetical protein POVWA1_074690 [Plasmodium ovale wallikeri]SBT58376.1 hypothetical protein POVWA2_084700 [Plasmodium ovale wallikeri]
MRLSKGSSCKACVSACTHVNVNLRACKSEPSPYAYLSVLPCTHASVRVDVRVCTYVCQEVCAWFSVCSHFAPLTTLN